MRILERSLVVSTWADARDMAVMVRWLEQTHQVDRKLTRSLVMSKALSWMARSITQELPELAIDTVEEAYEELFARGLAGKSDREIRSIRKALEFEEAQSNGTLNVARVEKQIVSSLHGEGYGRSQIDRPKSLEFAKLHTELGRQATEQRKLTWREEEVNRINDFCEVMIQNGDSPEVVERSRQAGLTSLDEREERYKKEQQEEQAIRIEEAKQNIRDRSLAPIEAPDAKSYEESVETIKRTFEKKVTIGLWTPAEAQAKIDEQIKKLEECYPPELRLSKHKQTDDNFDNEPPQQARADMTQAERLALEQREAAQLRDGLKGGLPKVVKRAS